MLITMEFQTWIADPKKRNKKKESEAEIRPREDNGLAAAAPSHSLGD